jgi:hypothetical protein
VDDRYQHQSSCHDVLISRTPVKRDTTDMD